MCHNFRVRFEILVHQVEFFHPLHCSRRPKASPMSTSNMGVSHSVLAITKFPHASQIQAPIPTLLRGGEKDALCI